MHIAYTGSAKPNLGKLHNIMARQSFFFFFDEQEGPLRFHFTTGLGFCP